MRRERRWGHAKISPWNGYRAEPTILSISRDACLNSYMAARQRIEASGPLAVNTYPTRRLSVAENHANSPFRDSGSLADRELGRAAAMGDSDRMPCQTRLNL